jgi:hypothetical protein
MCAWQQCCGGDSEKGGGVGTCQALWRVEKLGALCLRDEVRVRVGGFEKIRHAQVCQLGHALNSHQHVVRLDVAVHNVVLVHWAAASLSSLRARIGWVGGWVGGGHNRQPRR